MSGLDSYNSLMHNAAALIASMVFLWLLLVFAPVLYLLAVERLLVRIHMLEKRMQPYLLIRLFNKAAIIYVLFSVITVFIFRDHFIAYATVNLLALVGVFSYFLGKYTDIDDEHPLGFWIGIKIITPPVLLAAIGALL